jgi:hypothetical protein
MEKKEMNKLRLVYDNVSKSSQTYFKGEYIYKLGDFVFRFLYDSHKGNSNARLDILSGEGWNFLKDTNTTKTICANYLDYEIKHIKALKSIFKEFEDYVYALYVN